MSRAARNKSKELDKEVRKINYYFNNNRDTVMFLGKNNSGKHSFLKQVSYLNMKEIYSDLGDTEWIQMHKKIIEKDVFAAISTLCSFIYTHELSQGTEEAKQLELELQKECKDNNEICKLATKLYQNEIVYQKLNSELVNEFSREIYFLENMERILSATFVPGFNEILRSSHINPFAAETSKSIYSRYFAMVIMPPSNYIKLAHNFFTAGSSQFGLYERPPYNSTIIVYFINMLSVQYTVSDNTIIWNPEQEYIEDIKKLKDLNVFEDFFIIFSKYDLFLEKLEREGFKIDKSFCPKVPTNPVYEGCVFYMNCLDSNSIEPTWLKITQAKIVCY